MSKFIFKFSLFITSLLPLWILILYFNLYHIISEKIYLNYKFLFSSNISIDDSAILIFTSLILILIILCSVHVLLKVNFYKKKTGKKYAVIEVKKSKSITPEFMVSFVVPLIAFEFNTLRGILGFSIMIILIFYICYKSNFFYINIILVSMNYTMYTCKKNSESGGSIIVFSKENLLMPVNCEQNLLVYTEADFYIERRGEKNEQK